VVQRLQQKQQQETAEEKAERLDRGLKEVSYHILMVARALNALHRGIK
jgi:archaellum component FlaC